MKILPVDLLAAYKEAVSAEFLTAAFETLKEAELSTDGFSFYTSVASVYSITTTIFGSSDWNT